MRCALCGCLVLAQLAACASSESAQKKGSTPGVDSTRPPPAASGLRYPVARRGDVVDTYHGEQVADPYRWLEDPDSDETRAWIAAENAVTFGWLEQIPARQAIKQRLTALWDYEKFGVPFKEGGRYFYTYNPGLLNQSQLFTVDKLGDPARLLLDPNTLSEDGTVALSSLSVSRDGTHLAYSTSSAGSDWQEWRVRDVATGTDSDDHLRWSKFSGAAWTPDGKGFYYSAYDPPSDEKKALTESNFFQKLYYHRLGQAQASDTLVYQRTDHKDWGFEGQVTEDGRYLIIHVWQGTDPKNGLFFQDLKRNKVATTELLKDFDALYHFVGNDGPVFYVKTDRDAPRGRLVAIDTRTPDPKNWKELIAQGDDTVEKVSHIGGQFVLQVLKDARNVVRVHDRKGALVREVELPGIGSTGGFDGKASDSETFFAFTGFTTPSTVFRYDLRTGTRELFKAPTVDFDPAAYTTQQVFYTSKDGTRVPMFITHKKGLVLDGKRPTFLYGYGGFNISLSPWFSVSNLVWMELGGVYAVANLRGGNEYGEAWHQGGILHNKQNVFDDFIGAAEWLHANAYSSPATLAIGGGSNGGLLVGACMTQRPDLYAATLPQVGVLDMLRYHTWTIGWAWASDYGTSDDPALFKVLRAYSPYHNVKAGTRYPATLITTADHDDRVVPAHSFKFAAALQQAQAGDAPVLIRIETKAGHGAGKPTDKIIEETADRWAFVTRVLDMQVALPSWAKETATTGATP
ncbi:MAG: prolyl oligopeptidase family serine peptidase [Pseudomonadota bacterium]